jgi:hypothetical protein
METSQVKLEAADLGPNPEATEVILGQRKIPNGQATVQTLGGLEDRSGDYRQAVGYRYFLKRRTRDPKGWEFGNRHRE